MDRQQFIEYIELFYKEGIETIKAKNADYAKGNSPFANFMMAERLGITDAKRAILVRMSDKLARASNVLNGSAKTREKIRDTLLDLSNYSAILDAMIANEESQIVSTPHPPDEGENVV